MIILYPSRVVKSRLGKMLLPPSILRVSSDYVLLYVEKVLR